MSKAILYRVFGVLGACTLIAVAVAGVILDRDRQIERDTAETPLGVASSSAAMPTTTPASLPDNPVVRRVPADVPEPPRTDAKVRMAPLISEASSTPQHIDRMLPPKQSTSAEAQIQSESEFVVNVTLGKPRHVWNPLLGGVLWIASRENARKLSEALLWFPDPVLLTLKHQANGFGYRFDLDTWEKNTIEYGYYAHDGTDAQTTTNLDDQFQIFGRPNVRFILYIPVPHDSLQLGSGRFEWQLPEFYAAELQYLFGSASDKARYEGLPLSLDFFDTSIPRDFNWANLRARRGHPAPYRADAIVFGEEPYHIEGWSAGDGAGFGKRVNEYLAAMRSRGVTLPYGVHASQLTPTDRSWLKPLMTTLPAADPPSYLDLYHHYSFVTGEDWLRAFPVSERTEGFTNWWIPKANWRADYTRFLWIIEDSKLAFTDIGIPVEKLKLGFGEHGITISSPFRYNDMMGAIHYANWLGEIMRYDTDFDATWVLLGEGFSTALVQLRGGVLTKTPAFFAYEMAHKFKGLGYRETTTNAPYGNITNPEGQPVRYPYVIVRAFDAPDGALALFVINQHPTLPARLTGIEDWRIASWEELSGAVFSSGNELGTQDELVRIRVIYGRTELRVLPVSVNRIILAR